MSQENVEIVGRIYEAFQSGDLDRVTQLVSPDIELRGTSGGLSEGSVARGIAAVREMFEGWDEEVWEEIRLSPQEFIDAGDQVVVLQHELRRGRGSGVEVESKTAVLFELRDGKVTRIQGFMDQEQALEAAGLSEQAMSQENVEIVKRAIAAVNERDVDAYLSCCTKDVKLSTPVAEVAGVYEGPDGIRRFFADVGDTGPDFHLTIERVEAIGPDRVLAFMLVTATGRASGIPQDARTANVYDLAGGKIERIRIFVDREEALEAAGLRG